jgi:hypothetical protein
MQSPNNLQTLEKFELFEETKKLNANTIFITIIAFFAETPF